LQLPSELHRAQGAAHITQVLLELIKEKPSAQAKHTELMQKTHPLIEQVVHWPAIGISPGLHAEQKLDEEHDKQFITLHEMHDIPSAEGYKATDPFELHRVQTPASVELHNIQLATEHWLTQFPPLKIYPLKHIEQICPEQVLQNARPLHYVWQDPLFAKVPAGQAQIEPLMAKVEGHEQDV
jgi:hypothetical protein